MKVIKPGRQQTGWSKEFSCTGAGNGGGGCRAVLLVQQGDLYRTSSGHYDGSTDHFVTFSCVSCGVETDVGNVPSNVEDGLPSKESWKRARRDPTGKRADKK